jgi:hypothetical protein
MRNIRNLSAGTARVAVPLLLMLILGIADRYQPATPEAGGALRIGLRSSSPLSGPSPAAENLTPVLTGLDSPDAGWWDRASRAIEALEYNVSATSLGLQAPNRAHGIRTYFHETGIEVVPRRDEGGGWKWSWTTRLYGREGALRPAGEAAPASDRAAVHYGREQFVEWYENGPSGLEQGFTIASAPPGAGEICVAGTVGAGMHARMADRGASIRFADAQGRETLIYGKLAAYDASGKLLPSRLALAGQEIRILVDDRGAVYPIDIDPLLETPAWQKDGDCENASFGRFASTAGDVNGDGYSDVIISSSGYDHPDTTAGKVWAFYGSAEGLHTEPDWTATGDQSFAMFGGKIAAAGDVNGDGYQDVLIGAAFRRNSDGTLGRVYLYHGSPIGLTSPSWILDSDSPDTTKFGVDISTAGDVNGDGFDDVIISAMWYTDDLPRQGRAWIYLGSASGLSHTPAWMNTGVTGPSYYGACCGTAGDVNGDGYDDFILSAMREGPGRAYLYLGSALPLSTTPAWTAVGDGPGSYFGCSMANAGDVNGDGYADVLIARLYSHPEEMEGRVDLFKGTATGYEASSSWSAEGNTYWADFGDVVSTAGDINGDGLSDVCIGAPSHMLPDSSRVGRAYVYYGSRGGLQTDPAWVEEGDQADCYFGGATTTAGDVNGDGFSDLLVTAFRYNGAYPRCGRASVYLGSGDGPRETPGWVVESNQASAYFGTSVANAGDVNGDGYDEIIVGAPNYDNGETNEGAAFLFLGHGAGASVLPDWWAESNQASASFGTSVAGAGDVNGDGYDDVIVGAPNYDGTFSNEGKAFLWFGTPGGAPMGTPANAAWSCAGGVANAGAGYSVASAGDVDGDGFADVIVGMPGFTNGQSMEGKAAVYEGSATGPSGTANWSTESNQANALAGFTVAGAGDVNADGFCDVLVGAPYWDTSTFTDEGIAWFFYGSSSGVRSPYVWMWKGNQDNAHCGWSVAGAGDVNGDGYSDMVMGVPDARYGLPAIPGIVVAYGAASGPFTMTTLIDSGGNYGYSVASAGDVDGDGYSDIVVGVTHSTNLETGDPDCGDVRFIRGTPDGIEPTGVRLYGSQTGAFFGSTVASADVNGDGFSDILVGARLHSQGQTEEGRSFVYYGNDSRGLPRAPDQLRADLTAPIGLRAFAHSNSSVALRALGRMAGGRGEVWLEWQMEPTGESLDGTRIEKGSLHDTGAPVANWGSAVQITETFAHLVPATAQHWRLRIASRSPYFPRTPWFSPSGNAPTETDFRTEGSPQDVSETPSGSDQLLLACLPNPFRSITRIRYSLPAAGPAAIAVYDVQGRLVRTLMSEAMPAGDHEVEWNGADQSGRRLADGVYWIRLAAQGRESHRQVVLSE